MIELMILNTVFPKVNKISIRLLNKARRFGKICDLVVLTSSTRASGKKIPSHVMFEIRYFTILFIISWLTLLQTIYGSNINEEYSKERVLLQNVMHTVSHVIDTRPSSDISYYCVLLSSPPGGRPLEILNMLQLTHKSHIVMNIWLNTERNKTTSILRNCSSCESFIVFSMTADIEDLLDEVNVTCTGERIIFLVAICDVFESEIEASKFAEFIVGLAWWKHRGFATIVIPVDDRVLIFKSEQHVPHVICRPEPPRLMSYLENGTFVGKMSFKQFGYNKCAVRISSSTWFETVQLKVLNGRLLIAGFEGIVMNTIAEKHNFTMDVIDVLSPEVLQSKNICKTAPGIITYNSSCAREHLKSGEGDIAVCSLWISYAVDLKYSHSYLYHEVDLMIPVPLYIPFTSILNTFSKFLWICVFLGLIIGRILIRMDGRSISSLMTLALFLGVSVASRSRGFVEKWQMMLWVIYGYLITQSYIAALVAVLNNPLVNIIETIEELTASDLRVAGYAPYREKFSGVDRYKAIFDNFIEIAHSEYTTKMNDPEKYIPPSEGIAVLVNSRDTEPWRPRYYLFKQPMFYHMIGMAAMTRSTVSLREFDKTILHLVESGLLRRWYKIEIPGSPNVPNFTDIETPSPTLSLKEETGIFVLLAVGLFLSTLVFIYEIWKK